MRTENLILIFGFIGLALVVIAGLTIPRLRDARLRDKQRVKPGSRNGAHLASEALPTSAPDVTAQEAHLAEERTAIEGQRLTLERGDELRNLLMSKMSHDLRTPLNSVITLSQLLVEGSAGPLAFEQRKYLEVIHRNGQNLLALVSDILDLATLEAGRVDIEQAPVDLGPLIQSVATTCKPLARRKSLPVHLHLPRKVVLARTDEERLRQVLTNLLQQAIHQTSNGYVEISADSENQRATIRISDTGAGLSKQARGALFDDFLTGLGPFAENAEQASPPLGLVIAGRLIKLMGGEITIDSDDREGTTFVIALPLAAEEAAVRPQGSAAGDDGASNQNASADLAGAESVGGHVLLIEDDEIERRRVGTALEGAGYDVTLAASGQEGLALLHDGHFDAVVLDLVMPGMSGLDVLRAARGDDRVASTPIIVLSALYMSKGERDVLGPSVVGVVRKGETTVQELVSTLRQAIKSQGPGATAQFQSMMRPARVLVVDDNADNLFSIKQILASLPVTIETAASGQEAIELCRRQRPDVIMMDVQLPGLSGLDATRAIRELPDCRNIPIIALTADAMKGDRERVLAAQCSDYLSKPVQPIDVVSAVTRALQIQIH